jgi:zinc transport system ATP-binding protein
MKSLIKSTSLSVKVGGKNILSNINFSVYENEILSIIGLNGSGKTTLLKTLAGIIKSYSGTLKIHTKKIGYVPQKLDFDRTVPFSVLEVLKNLSLQTIATIENALEELDAKHLLYKKISDLSGGELQRVLIANAILNKPEILLFDEPTAGIDAIGEKQFYNLVTQIHKKYQTTIVLVSHDIHSVFVRSSRILCLHDKSICCTGTPAAVSNNKTLKELFPTYLSPYRHKHEDHCNN